MKCQFFHYKNIMYHIKSVFSVEALSPIQQGGDPQVDTENAERNRISHLSRESIRILQEDTAMEKDVSAPLRHITGSKQMQ